MAKLPLLDAERRVKVQVLSGVGGLVGAVEVEVHPMDATARVGCHAERVEGDPQERPL